MKKTSVVVIALCLVVSLLGIANASYRNGMGGGCSNCPQGMPSDQFRRFQLDTIDLRQEMMNKRFAIQHENLLGTPDKAKIALLQADIKAIQLKIMAIRSQSGLPVNKCDGECGWNMDGPSQKRIGPCGKGMGTCRSGFYCR
ncbi:MAG: hypothetical protein PHH28_05995 [Desulfuromonadaceae bacterium]|nr:hypothetical protein [Desulfuromonadaceae bacterium]